MTRVHSLQMLKPSVIYRLKGRKLQLQNLGNASLFFPGLIVFDVWPSALKPLIFVSSDGSPQRFYDPQTDQNWTLMFLAICTKTYHNLFSFVIRKILLSRRFRIYLRFSNALWAKLLRKWVLGIFPPQPPFSPSMIISERIFGDCPLSSFTFDIYLGTS